MSADNADDRPVTRPSLDVCSLANALRQISGAARVLMIVAPCVLVVGDLLLYLDPFGEHGSTWSSPRDMWSFLFFALSIPLGALGMYFFFGFVRFFAVYFGTVIEKRYL